MKKEKKDEKEENAKRVKNGNSYSAEVTGVGCHSFSRIDLLLNPQQLIEEDYPLPLDLRTYNSPIQRA